MNPLSILSLNRATLPVFILAGLVGCSNASAPTKTTQLSISAAVSRQEADLQRLDDIDGQWRVTFCREFLRLNGGAGNCVLPADMPEVIGLSPSVIPIKCPAPYVPTIQYDADADRYDGSCERPQP